MPSWVRELICHVWFRLFCSDAYTLFSILLRWYSSRGGPLSGTWLAAVGGVITVGGGATAGGSTLGDGTIDDVKGVFSSAGVGANRTGM